MGPQQADLHSPVGGELGIVGATWTVKLVLMLDFIGWGELAWFEHSN